MDTFYLDKHPHVALCDLLKLLGWCDSGAMAKNIIAEAQVLVDGEIETRKRCKILAGQQVSYQNRTVQVVG